MSSTKERSQSLRFLHGNVYGEQFSLDGHKAYDLIFLPNSDNARQVTSDSSQAYFVFVKYSIQEELGCLLLCEMASSGPFSRPSKQCVTAVASLAV